jgi:hypothetical protein
MNSIFRTTSCAALALGIPACSFALTFTNVWDSSLGSYSNEAQAEADVLAVESFYSANFSNPVTVNLQIDYSTSNQVLGESQTSLVGFASYTTVKNALQAAAVTPEAIVATGTLGATDPTGGGNFAIASAEAKALGIIPASSDIDGIFTFGNQPYALDPNNRAVSGDYDFIGVAEHEITEIMGRIPGLDQTLTLQSGQQVNYYLPFDLFRYTAPGVHSLTQYAPGAYYSDDGGVTIGRKYNTVPGADPQDWDGAVPDSYNAFGNTGVEMPVGNVDLSVMDVLGYQRHFATPEPSSYLVLGGGFGLLLLRRRRK